MRNGEIKINIEIWQPTQRSLRKTNTKTGDGDGCKSTSPPLRVQVQRLRGANSEPISKQLTLPTKPLGTSTI